MAKKQDLSPEAAAFAKAQAEEAAAGAAEAETASEETEADRSADEPQDDPQAEAFAERIAGATADLSPDTMAGDIRDAMLGHIRQMPKTWPLLSESDQRMIAEAIGQAARHLVHNAVMMVSNHGFPHCAATLGEVKIKGEKGIEAKITAPNIEVNRNILGDHVGDWITVVMIDSETFKGERAPAQVDLDQPELPTEQPLAAE